MTIPAGVSRSRKVGIGQCCLRLSQTIIVICFAVIAATSGTASATTTPIASLVTCDRACLRSFADRYFEALVRHSPKGLPLDAEVRMTENTIPLAVGQGVLWRGTTSAPASFRIDVIDPASAQIAVGALIQVDHRPALIALRLRVADRKLIEIEQLYTDFIQPAAWRNLQAPRAAFLTDVPAAERNSRGELSLIVNSYFEALTSEDSHRARFASDCERHEGGLQTTGNATPPPMVLPSNMAANEQETMRKLLNRASTLGCAAQVDSGVFADLWKVWPRRPIVIDEQKGLVAAFPMFRQNGDVRPSPLKGYTGISRVPHPLPGETQWLEIFKVYSGQIHQVEAPVFITLPFGAGNGWDYASVF